MGENKFISSPKVCSYHLKLTLFAFLSAILILALLSSSSFADGGTYNPGHKMSVSISGMGSTNDSWVGFYKQGVQDNGYLSYSYLRDLTGGVYTVVAPKEPGTYEFRFFKDSGYVRTAVSVPYVVAQYTPTIQLSVAEVRPNEAVTATYAGGPIFQDAWIGFYPESAPNTGYSMYQVTKGAATGTYQVKVPSAPGRYNFRIFLDGGYTFLAKSDVLLVGEFTPTLTLQKNTALPGEKVVVTFANGSNVADAWVGMYSAAAPNNSYLSYQVTKGAKEGAFTFTLPMTPGNYNFRIFKDAGYTLLAKSENLVVGEFAPTLTLQKNTAIPGEKIEVSFTNGSSVVDAWIGMYKVESPDKTYINYQYTKGLKDGKLIFALPQEPGTYNFRIYKDNGYTRLGLSESVVVQKAGLPVVTAAPVTTKPVTTKPVISQPTQLTTAIAEVMSNGVRLAWPKKDGVVGYRVYRSDVAGDLGISVTDFYLLGTTLADVNVEPNTTYYYTIKTVLKEAVPAKGESEVIGETIATFTLTTGADIFKPGTLKQAIQLQLDNPMMVVNGEQQEVDPGRGTVPQVIANRTMVPIRAVVEAMGGSIKFDSATQKLTLNARGIIVEMWIGKTNLKINGVAAKMDVGPIVRNERTYVPLRFATESLKAKVEWLTSTKEAIIIFE